MANKSNKAAEVFKSFNDLNVLIIGDVMIDSYVWGNVTRISPEAPVPIVAVTKKENRLGGAANVALNVKAMGANPILCSMVGSDDNAKTFLDLLKKQKLSAEGILKSNKRITTVKTRIIGDNHQLVRVDEEMEGAISSSEEKKLTTHIIDNYIVKNKVDVIIFEDYDKGLITEKVIRAIVDVSNIKGIPTVVDPKKKNFLNYKNVCLFKPNLKELKEGLKVDLEGNETKEIENLVSTFRKKQNISSILLTLSEKGIYIQDKKGKAFIPAHIRNISDVSGAGDTVVSVAALCLALKLNPEQIATISNLAGGLVCEKVGVIPIDKKQLLKEVSSLKILA